MAKMRAPGSGLWLRLSAVLFSLLSLILILLVLLAGTNNHLTNFFYLKIDVRDLSIPSRLARSTILRDLSQVSRRDFVGSDQTAASLGLGETYTISLLTSCSVDRSDTADCSPPRLGFAFDPRRDLKLGSLETRDDASARLSAAVDDHGRVARFMAGSNIAAALLTVLAPTLGLLGARRHAIAVAAAVCAALAAALLLASSVAAPVVFHRLAAAFDAAYGAAGVRTSVGGRLFQLSWAAFVFALVSTVVLTIAVRGAGRPARRRAVATGAGGIGPDRQVGAAKGPKAVLLNRFPTWNRHRYMQIEKAVAARAVPPPPQPPPLPPQQQLEQQQAKQLLFDHDADDWEAHDEYASNGHGARGQGPAGVPMVSIGGHSAQRNMNMAYEPYSSTMF